MRPVNFDEVRKITQGPNENPALFLSRLSDNLRCFANLDLDWVEHVSILAKHFILVSF
jgi:hypothetical protein